MVFEYCTVILVKIVIGEKNDKSINHNDKTGLFGTPPLIELIVWQFLE